MTYEYDDQDRDYTEFAQVTIEAFRRSKAAVHQVKINGIEFDISLPVASRADRDLGGGVPAKDDPYLGGGVPAKDDPYLKLLNTARARKGRRPLDPKAAGFTASDVREAAAIEYHAGDATVRQIAKELGLTF